MLPEGALLHVLVRVLAWGERKLGREISNNACAERANVCPSETAPGRRLLCA